MGLPYIPTLTPLAPPQLIGSPMAVPACRVELATVSERPVLQDLPGHQLEGNHEIPHRPSGGSQIPHCVLLRGPGLATGGHGGANHHSEVMVAPNGGSTEEDG